MMNKKMRVCIVAEGCYPYVIGGVSGWINSMIRSFPNIEFIVLAIVANRSLRGKFQYELPENLTEVYELYLQDVDWSKKHRRRQRLKKEQYRALRSLILDQDVQWNILFDLFQKNDVSLNDLLMGEDFLHVVTDCYNLKYSSFSIFLLFCFFQKIIYYNTLNHIQLIVGINYCISILSKIINKYLNCKTYF